MIGLLSTMNLQVSCHTMSLETPSSPATSTRFKLDNPQLQDLASEFLPLVRLMGTYNPTSKSTYNLLGGLRGLISTVVIGVISAHEPPSKPKP